MQPAAALQPGDPPPRSVLLSTRRAPASAGVSSSHPTFSPWGAPSLSWVSQTVMCKKSPRKKLLPSRHRLFGRWGELHH